MGVGNERGCAVIGNLALVRAGDMVAGDVDAPSGNRDMAVGDQLPGLFRRPCESPAVHNGLETAFELGLDLERKDIVDVRIGAEETCTLEVADELFLLGFVLLLVGNVRSKGQQVAGALAVLAQVGLCFPDFALVPETDTR